MRYQEYPPPVDLRHIVRCVWSFETASRAVEETIVADGYPELILHTGVPCGERSLEGRLQTQPSTVVAGQLTRPLRLYTPAGARMIAVRFHPCGLARLASDSMKALTDCRTEAQQVVPNLEPLYDAVAGAKNEAVRVASIFKFVRDGLGDWPVSRAETAVELIERTGGALSVSEVASRLGLSLRKLQLLFSDTVGVSPKMFSRVVRFRHVTERLADRKAINWTQLALDAGFFDQPHMIRDFKQFSGQAPGSCLEELVAQAGHAD